jgi:hypothetical protein
MSSLQTVGTSKSIIICALIAYIGLKLFRQQLSDHVVSAEPDGDRSTSTSRQAAILVVPDTTDHLSGHLGFSADMNTLDESWPFLWTDDFSCDYSNPTEQDILNMYLLGLPQVNQ